MSLEATVGDKWLKYFVVSCRNTNDQEGHSICSQFVPVIDPRIHPRLQKENVLY